MPHPWPLMVFLVMLLVLAIAAAALLRQSGLSRIAARTLGGAMAGLLMSPSILGAIAPDAYRVHVSGGWAERQARQSLVRRHTADLLAAEHARTAPNEIVRLRDRHSLELDQADNALASAEARHQLGTRIAICITIATVLLGSGAASIGARDLRQGWATPLSIGVWAAAFPAALAYAASVWWWEFTQAQAGMLAAAVAIGPWRLTAVDVDAANQVEFGGARMVQTAGRIASLIGVSFVIAALAFLAPQVNWWWCIALLALPTGWMLERIEQPRFAGMRKFQEMTAGFDNCLIPFLAALVAAQVSIFEQFALWPLLVIAVLSGDGRWLGAVMGAILPGGRSVLRAMRLVMGSMAAGPTQLAIAGVAACDPASAGPLLVPMLAGSILIDLTVPLRRKLAQELVEAESELAEKGS